MPTYDEENANDTNFGEDLQQIKSWSLLKEEQRGWRKETRGMEELMNVHQHILKESKIRRKIDSFKLPKISDEVMIFMERTMKSWKLRLTAGGISLA